MTAQNHWKWDPKAHGPAYLFLREHVRALSRDMTREHVAGFALTYAKDHGLPVSPAEIAQMMAALPPSISGAKPSIEDDGIGWRVSMTTTDPKIDLVLRVKPTRSGSLTVVEATVDGRTIARDSTERIDSMNQREFVATSLGKRCGWDKEARAWLPLIEAVVVASRSRRARSGETWAFDIDEARRLISERGPGFVAKPFIRPGNDSILYGPPGRAKTKIVNALDLGLATAKEVIPGMFGHIPEDHEVEPINVLHINLENDRQTLDGDIYRTAKGAGITVVGNLHVMRLRVPFLDAVEMIAEYVKVNQVDHQSVDSIQTAIGSAGASNGSGDTWGAAGEAYFDALDAIRHLSDRPHLSTLSIDHSKGQPEVMFDNWADRFRETLYGSSRKYARARAAFLVLNLKGRDNPDALTVVKTIGVYNHKEWPDLPRADDAFIEVVFDNAAFSTTFGEVEEPVADGTAALTGKAKIVQTALAAKGHRLTVPELVTVTGLPRTTITSALTRNPAVFVDHGSTGWGLVAWADGNPASQPSPAASRAGGVEGDA